MTWRIRPYIRQDASALAAILHNAVHQIGARDYTDAQLTAWSPRPAQADAFHARVSDGRDVLVAVDAREVPIAFIELKVDGHIDCFYCDPALTRSGVGAALYQLLEDAAAERGIDALFVEASDAARRFFEKVGFTTEKRRDFKRNGVQIHNYLMRKTLRD